MPREYRAPGDPRSKVYNAKQWQHTRKLVFARDNYECVKCGAHATVCDHIDPLLDIIEQGRDPFDPSECQSLCHPCSGHKDGGRASKSKAKPEPKPNRFLGTVVRPQGGGQSITGA